MNSSQRQTVTGFIALAVLAGPMMDFVVGPMGLGAQYLSLIQMAVASGLAAVALLSLAALRRERLPRGGELIALLALYVPQVLIDLLAPTLRAVPALHETPWGVALFISLAAPLWLALLAALQWIPDLVPRAVVGASIAGIGAACLVVPGDAYTISPNQIPAAVLHVLLAVLTVFSWSYARPRLAATGAAAGAGCFLVPTALGQIVASFATRDVQLPFASHEAILPLLLMALVSAVSWWLWFWLLERTTLAAFGMRALGAWTASILTGFFLFGLRDWRIDAAFAIAAAALVVALRARATDEQLLALGLTEP